MYLADEAEMWLILPILKPKLRRLAAFLYNINSGIWSYRAQGESSERELQDWEMTVWNAAVSKCFE